MGGISEAATGGRLREAVRAPGALAAPRVRFDHRGLLWVAPSFLLFLFVEAFPFGYAIWLSLHEKRALSPVKIWVGPDNYVEHLTSPDFWLAVRVGSVYAFGSVAIQLVLGLGVALLLHRSFSGRGLARAVALLPYMVPTATMALVFAFMFNDLYGIVNRALVAAGVIDVPILFFGSMEWALPAVILAATWKWMPFVVIVMLARLQTIDQALYECARIEGAGAWACFRDITLPALRSVIFLVVLLRGIWMFNKFDIPYLLTGGGPLGRTTNLPIYAYNVMFLEFRQGDANALAVIMCALLFVFALVYFRIFRPEREIETE